MTKLVGVLVACVLLSLGAGGFIGAYWVRRAPPPDPFERELNLTSEQQDKMREIWSEAMRTGGFPVQDEKKQAAQKEYYDALRALVPADQQARCDEVLRNYRKKLEDIEQESKKIFDDATERSRQVLDERQRAKFDEMRTRHSQMMRGRGPGGRPGPFGPMPPPHPPGSSPPGPPPPGPPPKW
jgi:Spy/CpxP family protein refolding chaperone